MHKIKTKTTPKTVLTKFQKSVHLYPTQFSNLNFIKPPNRLNQSKNRITYHGSRIWNDFLTKSEKELEHLPYSVPGHF